MAEVLLEKKVLLVSSDIDFLEFFRDLADKGYRIIETPKTDDEHFYPLIKRGEFDLIILDAVAPEMKGLELCSKIRIFTPVPVMVFSAWGVPKGGNAIRAIDLNKDTYLDNYLTGCFTFAEAVKMIERIFLINAASANKS